MSARQTSPRAIRKALELLLELPSAALADLTERLVDRLDTLAGPAAEDEPDHEGACEAEDVSAPGQLGIGDEDDAEQGEPDEPSLGWPERNVSSLNSGANDDREGEPCDDEPDFPVYQHRSDVLGAGCWTGASHG